MKGKGKELMVREDSEVASFQHVVEMHDCLVDSEQLSIVCAVFLLRWVELLGKCEGLPGVVDALLFYGTHGGSGGVSDECKLHGWHVTSLLCTR
jgi:hypothetical protein